VKLNARSIRKYLAYVFKSQKQKSRQHDKNFNSIQKTHSLSLHSLLRKKSSSFAFFFFFFFFFGDSPRFPNASRSSSCARPPRDRVCAEEKRERVSLFQVKEMKRTTIQVLVFALLASVDAILLFARAATQSGTWPLGIYKNQTITMKNFNTEDNYGGDSDGVGKILFDASLTSLTKGELILGSADHANAADGKHNVGAKIIALQAEQDSIVAELADLNPPV
jgi:hypothetical protein